ncbi:MAG: tol-pal system protein YbgF [Pseudomonadota bacterium]|nr:tol-pal system protein YbgF [Pseudomonadota bacterium]
MSFSVWRIVFLGVLALLVTACKVPLDERQAVTELQKKVTALEQELESGAGRQQSLKLELETLQLRFDEVRDQLLKQAEELQALTRAQVATDDSVLLKKGKADKKASEEVQSEPSIPIFSEKEEHAFEKLYSNSMMAYHDGDYETAVKLFATYLRDFPSTAKAANARYWLGESYYSLAQYAQAITEFKRVRKDFPVSSKVPDALLKTAMSYEAIGGREPAVAAYSELLRKYPGSLSASGAEKALARLE